MRLKDLALLLFFVVMSVLGISCGMGGSADPFARGGGSGSSGGGSGGSGGSGGEDQFEVTLVRVADLEAVGQAAFTNIGTDPLAEGEVEVEELSENEVEAEVKGAAANVIYDVNFCSSAGGPSGCFVVARLATDAIGNGEVEFPFPQRGGFAGVFTLTRDGLNQFVTGFPIPVPASAVQVQAEEEGEGEDPFEVDLQPVSVIDAGLGAAFGNNGNDPLARGRVEVEGDREVEAEVRGAVANAAYKVHFCRFGIARATGCILIGTLFTDAEGRGKLEANFPQMGTFDGIFVLTREVNGTVLNQFATGFRII